MGVLFSILAKPKFLLYTIESDEFIYTDNPEYIFSSISLYANESI